MTEGVFTIPLWIDLLAVGIGSMQGAAFAAQFRDRRLDLLGVAVIGIAVGFGGGLIRDILLNQVPLALQSNWYLPVATGAALVGMLLQRLVTRLGVPIANPTDGLTHRFPTPTELASVPISELARIAQAN